MPTEVSAHSFCRALPEHIRRTVEMMAKQFWIEPWPVRFLALLSLLEDTRGSMTDGPRLRTRCNEHEAWAQAQRQTKLY